MTKENEYQTFKNYTEDHYQILLDDAQRFHYSTGIEFLARHKGWRRGKTHFILGSSGMGKSTLMRTLVADFIRCNDHSKSVGIVLSEETVDQFITEYNATGKLSDTLDNIFILPELDVKKIKNADTWFEHVEKMLDSSEVDIFFYDNLTTSRIYSDLPVNQQGVFYLRLKSLCLKFNIPFVVIGHTQTGINENFKGIIDGDHIRGNRTPYMASEFFYVVQAFHVDSNRYTTIRIVKHRGFNPSEKLFQAIYFKNAKMFGQFEVLNFENFKQIFKERNTL